MRGSCLDKYSSIVLGPSKQKFLALPLRNSNVDIYVLWIYWWNVRQRFKIRFLLQCARGYFCSLPPEHDTGGAR